MKLILQPLNEESIGEELKKIFNADYGFFTSFHAAVAFVKASGLRHIQSELENFIEAGYEVKIIAGIDHNGTTAEALTLLLSLPNGNAEFWINNTSGNYTTFHPKIYLFENQTNAIAIIGSNNLTEGGLFTNDEAAIMLFLDFSSEEHRSFLSNLRSAFDYWSKSDTDNAKILDAELLEQLIENGYVIAEAIVNNRRHVPSSENKAAPSFQRKSLFGKSFIKRKVPSKKRTYVNTGNKHEIKLDGPEITEHVGFLMTLQQTDVGSGQTTPGASRRSPEVFIPLAARKMFPEFWGWQHLFTEDPNAPGKYDRKNVRFRIAGETVSVNMMTWPAKSDFRLRSEALRSAGRIGDIIRIEKSNNVDFDYYVEIIPQQTSDYDEYLALCKETTRNSSRLWGYYQA